MALTIYEEYLAELKQYIESRRPIIYMQSCDFANSDEHIRTIAKEIGLSRIEKYEWSAGMGRRKFCAPYDIVGDLMPLQDFLRWMITQAPPLVCVLKDVHNLLDDSEIRSLIQLFVAKNEKKKKKKEEDERSILIIESCIYAPPTEIEKFITRIVEPYPDGVDIEIELGLYQLKTGAKTDEKIGNSAYNFAPSFMRNLEENKKDLVSALKGMTLYEIRSLLYYYQKENNNKISPREIRKIYEDKKRIVRNSGVIEVVEADVSMEQVGGLDALRMYLQDKKDFFDNQNKHKHNVPVPKGILLVGAPGCGKTMTAKSIAGLFGYPLLRLDIGRLMGKYVGESEHNLEKAIAVAEAAQPCVLWIDEIEKAFAGLGSGDGGSDITVTRMTGFFLTWMQERKSMVYIVATANDLSKIREEFTRKGRWDETFYLTYPEKSERETILSVCLAKYGITGLDANAIRAIAEKTEGYSGAEIDSLVQRTYENHFVKSVKALREDLSVLSKQEIMDVIKEEAAPRSKQEIDSFKKKMEEKRYQAASKIQK